MTDRAEGPLPTRLLRLTDATGLWCLAGYGALALLARAPGEPALPWFFVLVLWTGLPVVGLFLAFPRTGHALPVGRLVFWTVAFRLCGLAGGPFYEDDFYRYLWDGFRFATAGTPYGAAPEAFFVDPAVPALMQSVLDGVNYPELPTIYAPVTQLAFLLAYWIKPASVLALQSILIAVDLLVVLLLLRMAPARNVLLYAWCPLVVKEVAFTAHPDGIGVCLLLGAVVLARNRRWRGAAVLLGMAVATKTFALVIAPVVLLRARVRHWLLFVATVAVVYLPFVARGGADLFSLGVFARDWEFNSALFGLLKQVMSPADARVLLGLLFAAFWVWYCLRRVRRDEGDAPPRGDLLFGALLAVSPVINPWYLLWLLPFAVLFPSVWAWTASFAVLLGYVNGLNLPDYTLQPYAQPLWARGLEFGLILLAVAVDLLVRRRTEGKLPSETEAAETGAPGKLAAGTRKEP